MTSEALRLLVLLEDAIKKEGQDIHYDFIITAVGFTFTPEKTVHVHTASSLNSEAVEYVIRRMAAEGLVSQNTLKS